MNSPIEEIKRKIDIVDFIGGYITLKKAGRNFKAVCPFHQEKTPSFVVSPERQLWHCFGACAEGGDIFKFLMKWENISFFEALKELAQKTGVKLERIDFEDQAWKLRERLFAINDLASQFYTYILEKHKAGQSARDYLKSRNISDKLVNTFGLGYAPADWETLTKFLLKKNYTPEELVSVGLSIKSDRGSIYDRFRGRIMFPLKDSRGNILGFSGRVLDGVKEAKYINTPETPIYHKRETLFGIDVTRQSIRNKDQAIIVEGEFDMISLFRNGIDNVVAVKGSAVTHDQLVLLSRITKKITLALDFDEAGIETTKRAIHEAETLDFEVSVLKYDFGKDPDEAVNNDLIKFKKLVTKPIPIYDFIIDAAVSRHETLTAFAKKQIADEVVPFLSHLQNPIIKSHYLKKVADLLEVDDRSVDSLILRYVRKEKIKYSRPIALPSDKKIDRYLMLENYIMALIIQNEQPFEFLHKALSIISIDDFSIASHKKIVAHLEERQRKDSSFNLQSFTSKLAAELKTVFDELYLFDIAIFDEGLADQDIEKILYEFKRLSLKEKIKQSGGDDDDNAKIVDEYLKQLNEVEKKLTVM